MNKNIRAAELSPVLVPAFPAVLRASPCTPIQMPSGCFDLRNPAVRDAIVRAIWRRLRFGDPELLAAPGWYYDTENEHWLFSVPIGWDRDLHETFTAETGSCCVGSNHHADHDVRTIPALASIPLDSPDRDLLALAEVAKAVLA